MSAAKGPSVTDPQADTESAPQDLEPQSGQVDPRAWAKRMEVEFAASRKEVTQFHEEGTRILRRFRDERPANESSSTRLNAYSMNIQTQRAMVLGKIPQIEVERRFSDANDDLARVAASMGTRMLSFDISRVGDGYAEACALSLDDRLQPGLGVARARYVPVFETVPAQAPIVWNSGPNGEPMEMAAGVEEHQQKTNEDVEMDYIHWKDFLWSAGARVPSEIRWGAHKSPLTRKQVVSRFGESLGRLLAPDAADPKAAGEALARSVPLNHKKMSKGDATKGEDPWPKSDVWEVWIKEYGCVLWFVEGFPNILDYQEDPLGLDGFFPWPRSMRANTTTDTLVPRADFMLAKDQYNLLDRIESRRVLLIDALRVAGVYDKNAGDLARMVKETDQNELIPVDNWAMFAEKGGIKGQIDLFPIDMVASVLEQLSAQQDRTFATLSQVNGFSDIARGEALDPGATATERRAQTRFASVRMQGLQEEWTDFAAALQSIKFEIICKHFDVETIVQRSNVLNTPDAHLAYQAAEFLKSDHSQWRIKVTPRSTNLQDFAAIKAERTEFMQGLSTFVQSMAPIVQTVPGSAPYMLEILKWYMAAQKDSGGIESTLDEAIAAAQQMISQPQAAQQQPQGPSPEQVKLQTQQLKGQQDMQKVQADLQAKLVERQADVAAKDAEERSQAHWNILEARGKRTGLDTSGGGQPVGILGGGLA